MFLFKLFFIYTLLKAQVSSTIEALIKAETVNQLLALNARISYLEDLLEGVVIKTDNSGNRVIDFGQKTTITTDSININKINNHNTDNININSKVIITNNLNVNENIIITKNLNVNENAIITKNLNVNENAIITKNLNVNENAIITKNLNVNDLTVNEKVTVIKTLSVNGDIETNDLRIYRPQNTTKGNLLFYGGGFISSTDNHNLIINAPNPNSRIIIPELATNAIHTYQTQKVRIPNGIQFSNLPQTTEIWGNVKFTNDITIEGRTWINNDMWANKALTVGTELWTNNIKHNNKIDINSPLLKINGDLETNDLRIYRPQSTTKGNLLFYGGGFISSTDNHNLMITTPNQNSRIIIPELATNAINTYQTQKVRIPNGIWINDYAEMWGDITFTGNIIVKQELTCLKINTRHIQGNNGEILYLHSDHNDGIRIQSHITKITSRDGLEVEDLRVYRRQGSPRGNVALIGGGQILHLRE